MYLKSEASGASAGKFLYKSRTISIKDTVVTANTTSPQIAAVAYEHNKKHEIRVYYIDKEGHLREVCCSDGVTWYEGQLDDVQFEASPTSLLTASVDYSNKGQLVLYYNRSNDPDLWCAYATVGGDGDWSKKEIKVTY